MNRSTARRRGWGRKEQDVAFALMISLGVVVRDELRQSALERALTK